jgi:WD40 repeat protein
VERGAQLRQYGTHNDAVLAAAFSLRPLKIAAMARPNWLVAAGGAERVIRLYDAESGQLLTTLRGHRDAVIACAFSPSDELLLSLSKDRSAHLWSLASGALLRTFAEPEISCTAIAFHPEGALTLFGSADGALSVFDRRTGAMATFARSGSALIVACGYAQNGELLFSADAARWLRVYDVRTQQLLATFRAAHAITCAAAAPSGARFAVGDAKGGLTVVQLEGQPSSGRKRNLL